MSDNVFERNDVDAVCKYLDSKVASGAIRDWGLNFVSVVHNPNFMIQGVCREMWDRVILPELLRLIEIKAHAHNKLTENAEIYTGEGTDVKNSSAILERLWDGGYRHDVG